MPADYPLRFEPLFRRYLWGGRRLEAILGKPIGKGSDYAESWEVVDHGTDQSVVSAGEMAGKTLHDLVTQHGRELFGRHHPQPQFPLLFKFLDAHRSLSVQVHPNDEQARLLDSPDLGKTEAWVVLHAAPGSLVYAGLKRGFDRQAFEREVRRGTTELCLHRFEPRVGDCIFIPAGTIHALGEGLIIAEIQQASDTTFRVSDWNRVEPNGQPRPLHIDQALDVIDYDTGPIAVQIPQPTEVTDVHRLVSCDKFVLDRCEFDTSQKLGGDDRFHILAVLEGAVHVAGDPMGEPLVRGQTMILPASAGVRDIVAKDPTIMLDMYLP
ncbi:MAG: class I mannose-6-phosphate isomerase [Planctomycetes bacterium]|nr:class I mannose-6-phosphate isomerase [Planctomycetota bacterium]